METFKEFKTLNKIEISVLAGFRTDNAQSVICSQQKTIDELNETILQAGSLIFSLYHENAYLNNRTECADELFDFMWEKWNDTAEELKAYTDLADELTAEIDDLNQDIFNLGGPTGGSVSHKIIDSSADSESSESSTDTETGDTADLSEEHQPDPEHPEESESDGWEIIETGTQTAPAEQESACEDQTAAEDQTADNQEQSSHKPPTTHVLSPELQKQLDELPQATVRYEIPDKKCPKCGHQLEFLFWEKKRRLLGYVKGYLRYETIAQGVYNCPNCAGELVKSDPVKVSEARNRKQSSSTRKSVSEPDVSKEASPETSSAPAEEPQVQNDPGMEPESESPDSVNGSNVLPTESQTDTSGNNPETGITSESVTKPEYHIIKAPIPPNVIHRTRMASVSILTAIINFKFIMCVPYYSLERYFGDMGYDLTRAKMSKWVIKVALTTLEPFVNWMKDEVLMKQHHHQYDETYYPVLYEKDKEDEVKKRPGLKMCYLWGAVSAEYEPTPVCVLNYRNNRRMENPAELYEGFSGAFLADKYGGYNVLINEWDLPYGRCWNHWFTETKKALIEHDLAKSHPVAVELYRRIQELLNLDEEICRMSFKERYWARIELQAQKVYDLFDWCKEQLDDSKAAKLPKKVKKALKYGYTDPEGFFYFLTDPHMPMHNLQMERQNRIVAKQRRVSFFCTSSDGCKSLGIIYSLIATAELNHVPASRYMEVLIPALVELDLPDWSSATEKRRREYYEYFETLAPWSPYIQERCSTPGKRIYENAVETHSYQRIEFD